MRPRQKRSGMLGQEAQGLMNYVDQRKGNKTPAVGVLQKLLNSIGANLDVDGFFWDQTEKAVQSFQEAQRLTPDGMVGKDTWPKVSAGQDLEIVDCIDVFDRSLMDLEETDIASLAGHPWVLGGACNGVEEAVNMILRHTARRCVFLLRFHGHGAPGFAGISVGQEAAGIEELSDIDAGNFAEVKPVLARLSPIFGPYGSVQFMHCETGKGPEGRMLLQSVANTLGVPATAGVHIQLGGGTNTFRFEGPTFTALPGGESLRQWCQALPDLSWGMCCLSCDAPKTEATTVSLFLLPPLAKHRQRAPAPECRQPLRPAQAAADSGHGASASSPPAASTPDSPNRA